MAILLLNHVMLKPGGFGKKQNLFGRVLRGGRLGVENERAHQGEGWGE
jgi:hypothetical protein